MARARVRVVRLIRIIRCVKQIPTPSLTDENYIQSMQAHRSRLVEIVEMGCSLVLCTAGQRATKPWDRAA